MKPLPRDWRWARVGEVCELNPHRPGNLQRPDDSPTTFVPMAAVDERLGKIVSPELRPYSTLKKGYTYFEEGDVLFAKITPCMQNGKHAIARNLMDRLGFGTTEFHVLRPGSQVVSEWVHYYVRQPWMLEEAITHFTGSAGQQRVPDSYLTTLEIPLPPLAEQKRIAAILNEQLAAVERARAAAEAQLEAAKALPAAYLRAIFTGPEAQRLPLKSLGEFVVSYRNGFGRRPTGTESGPIVLRLADVSNGVIDLSHPRHISMSQEEIETYRLRKGDLLFLRVNGSRELVGRCVLVDIERDDLIYNDHLIRVRLREGLDSAYLRTVCGLPEIRAQVLRRASTSAGQQTIDQGVLASLRIPVPSLAEQQRIVARLSEQMAAAEKTRRELEAQLVAINALPAALLRRAFSGGL